jgi:endonuclease/exonuclease/phosphatase (EEP) superfamily protein YafD
MRVSLSGLLIAAGTVIVGATLAGFLGRLWWVFDLFAHFQFQYLLSISIVIFLLLVLKRFKMSAIFIVCFASNLARVLPYYWPVNSATNHSSSSLRAIALNVNTANEHYELVSKLIREHNPDILVLTEVNAAWIKAMESLRSTYLHQKCMPREDNFGIALYSKLPFTICNVVELGQAGVPSIDAEFAIQGQTLRVLGTHTLPPIDNAYSWFRNNQIEAVAAYLGSVTGPKILLGDLNMTPWSPYFGALLSTAKLVDSSRGRGLEPTWPTNHVWIGRIPIDFCLVSEEITVTDKKIGANVGSDHFPVIVDFGLAE